LNLILPLLSLLLAFGVSAALSRWLAQGKGPRILDHPNARSLHQRPTPRSGGLALIAGLIAGLLPWLAVVEGLDRTEDIQLATLLVAAALVGLVSFLDDWRGLARRHRLLAQTLAALVLIAPGLRWDTLGLPGWDSPLPLWLVWPLSLLFIVWMINLYNFMDGMDGFAASMAVGGFGALAVLGGQAGDWVFVLPNALLVAAALGFFTANFPPARLFMGDLGSSVLGLFAAGLSLWGAQRGLFPLWVAWLAFSPFIVDATWTLLIRITRAEPVWQAHRQHHYQRLVLAGWSHRQTLMRAWGVMLAAAACAVAAPHLTVTEQWQLLLGWGGIYALIHWRVERVVHHQ
jgi:UDP-N-acetylmuramyl pentapeptide phosphotransferase/UDP-N-acetylglucosamine-1-phosphate transferase